MPVQLFRLRGVPDDEADEVRQLLADHQVDFYETPGGAWGASMPALWLNDESEYERARALIDEYQEQRAQAARAERERARREGRDRSILDELLENPVRFVLFVGIAVLVLYLSTKPFLDLVD